MKRILNFLLTLVVITVFIVLINRLLGYRLDFTDYKIIALFTLAYGSANYLGIHLFLYILNQIFSKESQEKIRLILGIIFSILISVIATMLVNIVLLVGIEGKSIHDIWPKEYFFSYYLFPVFISFVATLIYFISDFYKKTYQTKNKKQELVIQKISSQYEGLQQQLSPHFLFNSLNVLDSLIEENPKSAQEFTQELSQIYRYVLEQQSNDFTTIKEELEFVKNYANLMSKRFESSVEMIISENIDTENKVLPLSIQLLIENAFKHNALNETHPLKIEIEQEGNQLVIKNNLIPKKNNQTTSQKGLLNIEERYRKLGLMMSIKKTENLFIELI